MFCCLHSFYFICYAENSRTFTDIVGLQLGKEKKMSKVKEEMVGRGLLYCKIMQEKRMKKFQLISLYVVIFSATSHTSIQTFFGKILN